MTQWGDGYTQRELDDAQARYGLRFPPDLIALLRRHRPLDGYDWATENERLREMLAYPFEMLAFDVKNGLWWPAWGERPATLPERLEVVREALAEAPRVIPLIGHRFIPEEPAVAGNPVFSMHGFDTIYYGANLEEYFEREFSGAKPVGGTRHIPFWSDLVAKPDLAFSAQ